MTPTLSVSSDRDVIEVGDSVRLHVVVEPASHDNQVRWLVDDTSSASIDSVSGLVRGTAPGKVVVIAHMHDSRAVGSQSLTVVPYFEIAVSPSLAHVGEGATIQLKVTYKGLRPGVHEGVKFISSDPALASVDSTGLVSALHNGVVYIKAVAAQDTSRTATAKIVVVGPGTE